MQLHKLILWFMGTVLFLSLPFPALSAPITITKIRDLNFGFCDAIPSMTYTVVAAELPGIGACQGATSARFDVTGDPAARAKVTLTVNVTITNGTESLTINLNRNPSGPAVCMGAGTSVVYVGGSTTIPAGGLTTNGLFLISTTLTLTYIGGSC